MDAAQPGNRTAKAGHRDEELVRALVERSLTEVDTFLRREDVRSALDELGSDPGLWGRARRDVASFLEERGVSIPEGIRVTARESEGQEGDAEQDASNAGIDIELLSSAIKHVVGVVDQATLVAVEATGIKQVVYACQLVEICRSESDPNIWGGKILWGCRTVCVGSGWKVV